MKNIWKYGLPSMRWFLGWTIFSAGMTKLMPFPGWIGPVGLIEELARYDLALYGRFIAVSQVLIGLLLITRRFATLGAIMLVPMLLNILVVTLSLNWPGTPYVVAGLLLMNAALLLADYPRLKFLLVDDPSRLPPASPLRTYPHLDSLWLLSTALFLGGVLLIPYVDYALIFMVAGIFGFLFLSLRNLWLRYSKRRLVSS